MIVRLNFPDQLPGASIDSVKIGNDVPEKSQRAVTAVLTEHDAGADLGAGRKGPSHAAGFQVQGIDGAVLTAGVNRAHGHHGL